MKDLAYPVNNLSAAVRNGPFSNHTLMHSELTDATCDLVTLVCDPEVAASDGVVDPKSNNIYGLPTTMLT